MLVSRPVPAGAGVPARDLWLGFGCAACMRFTRRERSGIGAGELVREPESPDVPVVRLAKLLPVPLLLLELLALFLCDLLCDLLLDLPPLPCLGGGRVSVPPGEACGVVESACRSTGGGEGKRIARGSS